MYNQGTSCAIGVSKLNGAILLLKLNKSTSLRPNDPFPETPLALLKLKDYVVHNVSLTWSSLRACSEPMEDSESWRKMFLFSVGKKKKFE